MGNHFFLFLYYNKKGDTMGLFNNTIYITLQLNAKLQPLDRGDFEDAIEPIIKKNQYGEITGGGTFLLPTKEIACCEIEFKIYKNKINDFISFLKQIKLIPKGSKILYDDSEIEIGMTEGLGLYLNGTDLPIETYKNSDINELISKLDSVLEKEGIRLSHYEGEKETALYYYGNDFNTMKDKIKPILETHPLCEKCRVVQIA